MVICQYFADFCSGVYLIFKILLLLEILEYSAEYFNPVSLLCVTTLFIYHCGFVGTYLFLLWREGSHAGNVSEKNARAGSRRPSLLTLCFCICSACLMWCDGVMVIMSDAINRSMPFPWWPLPVVKYWKSQSIWQSIQMLLAWYLLCCCSFSITGL